MKNIILIWQEIPEDNRVYYLNIVYYLSVTDEDYLKCKSIQGKVIGCGNEETEKTISEVHSLVEDLVPLAGFNIPECKPFVPNSPVDDIIITGVLY